MDIEEEDFGCLGVPTQAEMWKQHSALVQAEYEQANADLRRARANIAKLVEMHGVIALERSQALGLLESYKRDLSAALVELSALKNRLNAYPAVPETPRPYPFNESLPAVTQD